jgi:hypothetical protein
MTAPEPARTQTQGVAHEAARYLEVIDVFASLGADPHAAARAHAARARSNEERAQKAVQAAERKAVLRWRS